jgi:hypothetical protein
VAQSNPNHPYNGAKTTARATAQTSGGRKGTASR